MIPHKRPFPMSTSLSTAVSGMIAHQRKLDVVANNLANINTTAFKSQSINFADTLYQTIKPSAGGSDGVGGVNSNQIGSGVTVGVVSRRFGQGTLSSTGQSFDFAISGNGFFNTNNGLENLYTRAGSFSLDEVGMLVDGSNGWLVQRVGTVGEGDAVNPSFQTPGDRSIKIPLGASVAGQPSQNLEYIGNLDATSSRPKAEVLVANEPFQIGGVAASGSSLLNDVDSNLVDYQSGDNLNLSGTRVDGTGFTINLPVDNTTVLQDLVDAIDAELTDASALIDSSGNLSIIANNEGPASLTLEIADDSSNVGQSAFAEHIVEVEGRDGDSFETTIEVFDPRGGSHAIGLTFRKVDDNVWDLEATPLGSEDIVVDGSVQEIRFNEDGTLSAINGSGLGDANLEFQFDGFSSTQTLNLDFGKVSHLNTDFSVGIEQDGFPSGNLSKVSLTADGIIEGISTNGRVIPLAQLAIASFQNQGALEAVGANYFRQSANSGNAQIGTALAAGRGSVQGGELENSNVDIAQEFTQLIVAQRGFSANARTVTVADEILEELTNIIR